MSRQSYNKEYLEPLCENPCFPLVGETAGFKGTMHHSTTIYLPALRRKYGRCGVGVVGASYATML